MKTNFHTRNYNRKIVLSLIMWRIIIFVIIGKDDLERENVTMAIKNILILKGSPREKGNSSLLADEVIKGAQKSGAEVDSYLLHYMDIRPCDACDACQESGDGICIIMDDMQLVYTKLLKADVIVLVSPVYWFSYSAQLKLCIDRFYALATPKGSLLAGKQFALILTYGDTDPYTSGAINAIHSFQDMCRYISAPIAGIIYGSSTKVGEILGQRSVMDQAYNLGEILAQ
jgi:multimeric flavodoxin WrbA